MHEVKCYFVSYVKNTKYGELSYNHCRVHGNYHNPLSENEFEDILHKLQEIDDTKDIVILNYIEMRKDK